MSEKFGLDWRLEDFSRVYAFIEIMKQELKGNGKGKIKSDNLIKS